MISRRQMIMLPGAAMASRIGFTKKERVGEPVPADSVHVLPDQLLLKDYRPKSVYKIPVSEFRKAKFPFIDVHHHARVKTPEEVDAMVKIMDAVGVETTVAFSEVGPAFDESYRLYSKYPKRFKVWCGLNMADVDQAGFGPATLKELERCCKGGAVGVGEITDKGMGIGGQFGGPPNWQGTRPPGGGGAGPRGGPAKKGLHPDDSRMDPIWQKCADLGLPVNIHISDPYWSYLPQNKHNDGLMNGMPPPRSSCSPGSLRRRRFAASFRVPRHLSIALSPGQIGRFCQLQDLAARRATRREVPSQPCRASSTMKGGTLGLAVR